MRTLLPLLLVLIVSGCAAPAASPPEALPPAPTTTRTPIPTTIAGSPTPGGPTPSGLTPEPLPRPAAQPELRFPGDLPQVELDVELYYAERWMRIRQTVTLTNTSTDVWEEVAFNAPIAAVEGAFITDAISVAYGDEEPENTFRVSGDQPNVVSVVLPRPAEPDQRLTIEMRYRVIVQPVEPTSWPPIGTTGWRPGILQAGEFYPALLPYRDGAWQTFGYHPVGDPTFYALTTTRLTVTTDDEAVIVASGGPLSREGNTWRFEVEGARGVAFFASERYRLAEGEADGIPIYSYYLPEHEDGGLDAVQVAADSLALFERLYGPYPYDSLTVAENGFFGGMEYSALISITDYAYFTYRQNPDSILHALIAHEVAHQWWYGAVGNNQATEAWLDESLGFYSELIYYEQYYPAYTNWWWQARVFQFDLYGPVDATIYSYAESDEFILSMYGQAAQFVHQLRELMGDEAFFAFLQDYYRQHYGDIVTGQDFFDAVRRHTDEDLTPLLEAFFFDTGM